MLVEGRAERSQPLCGNPSRRFARGQQRRVSQEQDKFTFSTLQEMSDSVFPDEKSVLSIKEVKLLVS